MFGSSRLRRIEAKLDALTDAVLDLIVSPNDAERLSAAAARLKARTDKLRAAIAANTVTKGPDRG
jgi:hypothetical protein